MSDFQRVIKYFAIAFAVILAVAIISGIASMAVGVASLISDGVTFTGSKEGIDIDESFTNVKSVSIKNSTGDLIIEAGDSFRVVAENVSPDFVAKVSSNGTLTIEDNNKFSFVLWSRINYGRSRITVYMPKDFMARDFRIKSGAGRLTIDSLLTQKLNINAGAGSITGNNIYAEEVKIVAGVGSINLTDVNFTDADIDGGVGSLSISGEFYGRNKIDCGVGEVRLTVEGNIDDYNYNIKSGVGSVYLNGERITKGRKNNNRLDNSISVNGGVGTVRITFTQ